jgi:phage tail-like protein
MSGSRAQRHWLSDQLPRPLADDPLLHSFCLIFEDIADSVRSPVVGFENYLDAGLAPPEFVRWMARWLGLSLDASLPEHRQRSALRAAGLLLPWRGTKRGLKGLLESLVGSEVEVVEHGGVFREGEAPPYDPQIEVRVPRPGGIAEHQLRTFIEAELEAGAELRLVVGQAKIASEADRARTEEEGV